MVSLRSTRLTKRERAGGSCLHLVSITIALGYFIAIFFYFQSLKTDIIRSQEGTTSTIHDKYHSLLKRKEANAKHSDSAVAFVAQNCDLGSEEWWPKESWKRRTPDFFIAGAKKSSTNSLLTSLRQHPNIVSPGFKDTAHPHQSQFWTDEGHFDRDKVLVEETRRLMHISDYPVKTAKEENMHALTFEAIENERLSSIRWMKTMLCTMPWIKIIVILRNPVDSLFSQYDLLQDSRLSQVESHVSFEDFIQSEVRNLKQRGILPPDNMAADEYFGSKKEKEAWRNYQEHPDGEGYLSQSLYALQLEEWFDALRSIGRDPADCVKIFREEDMKIDPQSIASDVFQWLGLENFSMESSGSRGIARYSSVLPARRMVERLLAPYNQRLYKLLGKDWDDMWDSSDDEDVEATSIVIQTFKSSAMPEDVNATQNAFVTKYCQLGDNTSWWPTEEESWKRRAPAFLVIGAKKAGTTSIFVYLTQHPNILPGQEKELHTFDPSSMVQWRDPSEMENKVDVDLLRSRMYNGDYPVEDLKADPLQLSFDATPEYLLYSSFSTKAILCAAPWTKFVVSLRNPIDRLFSHYNFLMDDSLMPDFYIQDRKNVSFEEFVESDMEVLRQYGVIRDDIPHEEFFNSPAEQTAWRDYQKIRSYDVGDNPVVRSLYALQLEDWFSWLRAAGKNPETELLVILEEDMKSDANHELNRIVNFLSLPVHSFDTSENIMVTAYSSELKPETRLKLEAFFEPYNKRLYKLLGSTLWAGEV